MARAALPTTLREYDDDENVHEALTMLTARLEAQERQWEALDTKALGVIGLSLGVTALFLGALGTRGAAPEPWQWVSVALVVGLLAYVVAEFGVAFWPRHCASVPEPKDLMDMLELPRAPRAWCGSLARAVADNEPIVQRKARGLACVMLAVGAQVVVALVAALSGLARA